jgi:outer membrane protein assembly factor BamB
VTPTVDGDCVYTLGTMGHLYCLKTTDGAVVWSRDLPKDYRTQAPHWGYTAHPLVDGDKLICVVGGQGSVAVAFDKRNGREIWRALSALEPGYCPPTIIEAAGKRQLLIWHFEAVNSLNPETGELYWSVPLKADYGMSIVAPRQWDDLLWVGGVEDKSMLLKLGQDKEQPSAQVVWRGDLHKSIGPGSCTPILENGFLYGVDRHGQLRCVRLSDGERLWTTWDLTVGKRTSYGTAFLVKHGERFFIVSETGELIIAQLSPEGHREISRCTLMEPTGETFGRSVWWSHPAFANRCVYARNDKEIICASLAAVR